MRKSSSILTFDMRRLSLWPYVVAATFFGAEFLLTLLVSCSVLPILVRRDGVVGNPDLIHRMRCYLHLALEESEPLLVSQSNWLTGDEEVRLMGRYMLWAFLAPLQWVSFARLYTTASWKEIASVSFTTSLVMLLGLLSATSRTLSSGQVIWEWQGRIYFTASLICYLLMFGQVYSLPLDPICIPSARKYLRFAIVLWTAYPAAHASRSLGLLSLWQEQVFCYTLLDVIAKGVTLWICFSGPAFRIFLNSLGNHQIQSAMIDWKITVGDPDWNIKTPSTDGLAAMQFHWLGGDSVGTNFLQGVLDDDGSRESLLSTARLIDADPSFSTRKVPVILRQREFKPCFLCHVLCGAIAKLHVPFFKGWILFQCKGQWQLQLRNLLHWQLHQLLWLRRVRQPNSWKNQLERELMKDPREARSELCGRLFRPLGERSLCSVWMEKSNMMEIAWKSLNNTSSVD